MTKDSKGDVSLCWWCQCTIRKRRYRAMRSTDDLADIDPIIVHTDCAILMEKEGCWEVMAEPILFDAYEPRDADSA